MIGSFALPAMLRPAGAPASYYYVEEAEAD
jgi:hypothetical protein